MPEQHAHVLYTKLLLSRGHGYPLWTPEPDYSLCSAYVGRGICVGDVGIIRDDGGFDFIFNAFLEADDPVHEGGVPPNFSPLRTESPNPIRTIYFQHPRDSSVRSSHVSVKSLSLEASAEVPSIAGGGAGFEFTTSKDQAAVLILPQGGTRFDRKNLSSMRKYALEHAHEWYEYINSPNYLGREALNGSLCFVTGCDKTTAWGSAAMSKPSDTRQFSIKFLVGGLAEGRIALRSSWSTQEWTDTRIYPDQDIDMDAPLPVRENQGVFIRSFTISVREKSRITKILPGFRRPGGVQLVEMSGKSGNSPVIGSKAPYSDQRHDSLPGSAPVWKGNGDMICGSIVGNELMQLQISIINAHMKSFSESHQPESISDYPSTSSIPYGGMNIPVASQLSSGEQDHVVLQYFPERSTELLNPSVKFNEYILSTVPESDVVVTHDSAWMLPMLVADIFISGLSAPRFLMTGKPPSYVHSKRGRMKRTWYIKACVRMSTPDLKEIKMSTSFLSFGYARFFSCLFMPLSPLQVDAELPDYIDRFPTVNTSELVLEFAKGASYIFCEIPFSKESLQIQGARSSQVPQRPQFIHQDNLVMRYDGIGLVGCITEAGPVLRSSVPSTTVYNTSESIVAEINLLASPLTLYPVSMAPAPEDRESPSLSGSSRGTPTYNTVDLPRTPSASKGGCWTCRLRRKKCDEQREGDSCRTCVRLAIECLGWGPKRPEWMRDKQAVEAYKAHIKAELTRAGLIRGQPRTSMLQAHAAKPAPTSQPPTFHRLPAPSPKTSERPFSTAPSSLALDVDLRPFDYRFDPPRMGELPGIPGPSKDFHQLPAASYSDSNVNSTDFSAPMYQYTPQSSSERSELLDFDIGLSIAQHSNDQFDFNIRPPSPIQGFSLPTGRNPSDRVSLTSSDDLAKWLYHFLSIRLELPADQRVLRSGNPDYHGMKAEDMIMKDFGSQDNFQRYLKERFSNLKRGLGELTSLDEMDKHIKLMETEIRRPLNNFLDCVKKIICAESAVLTITERVFSLYTPDAQWEAMKELNRLFASSHPWLKDPIYSQDSVCATDHRKMIKHILNDYGAFKSTNHPQPSAPQEIRIAPMSPDIDQPGYRALPRSESDYPPLTMPHTTVNRSKKQEVTNHTQATLRPGSTQPGRTPREGRITTPSATDVPRTIDRPGTDWEKPSPPDRGRREAVSRPMSTPPKLSREQTERMVPYAVPERIHREERRSEQSPLSSQNHTMPSNRPEIPTRAPAQRTRAPLKHASSHIRGAAPAAPMDDVETIERNITGPVFNVQYGSYLEGTGRYNDRSDERQHQPQNVGLPPESYGHGNAPNRDDDMRILDEPHFRLSAADQVRNHVQISATGGLEPSTGAELWPSSSDIPIQQGLDEPVITGSPPPPYEAVLQQSDSEGTDSAENLLGNSNENRPSSAYGRRRHITAPEPPWDAELVAAFRSDPPGIVGHKFLLDRITDACEYTVLDETDRRFLIRAKYNGQQMVQKLRYSELDIGLNAVVRDVQAYFDANPHRVRGAKLRVTGNDEKYKISAYYLEDDIRWFEITQTLTYGEMLRMIRLSHRWDMSL